eukprot:TRINITY_DN15224_c0_g2_i1.p1 TRINITY_DN15224_c0_g2~~TRINITY_DN15224_c0_g2_i1.p1  ORF type:complete len:277 (-),score=99.37 TRINITY_DN15224_c0_g2_i1:125-835(-)
MDDGDGCLMKSEFQTLCQKVKYDGDAAALFEILDAEKSGVIAKDDFLKLNSGGADVSKKEAAESPKSVSMSLAGPDAARADFATFLQAQDMKLEGLYKKLDPKKTGQVTVKQFQEVVTKIGFTGDAKAVFDALDADESGTLAQDEFMELADDPIFKKATKAAAESKTKDKASSESKSKDKAETPAKKPAKEEKTSAAKEKDPKKAATTSASKAKPPAKSPASPKSPASAKSAIKKK